MRCIVFGWKQEGKTRLSNEQQANHPAQDCRRGASAGKTALRFPPAALATNQASSGHLQQLSLPCCTGSGNGSFKSVFFFVFRASRKFRAIFHRQPLLLFRNPSRTYNLDYPGPKQLTCQPSFFENQKFFRYKSNAPDTAPSIRLAGNSAAQSPSFAAIEALSRRDGQRRERGHDVADRQQIPSSYPERQQADW